MVARMSNSLHSRLSELATSFADAVLAAARASTLDELIGPPAHGQHKALSPQKGSVSKPTTTTKSSGRLHRRSADEVANTLEHVVRLVKGRKEGLRAEQIREELGLQRKEMPRVLQQGLATRKLTCKGRKRATTYFAATG
jgi:hypothetical protein